MNHDPLQWLVTRVMSYGKYQVRLIAGLPGRHLNWFARKGFPPGEIGLLLALNETIRLMAKIDRVTETHGGWPGAFQSANAGEDLVV